ncbi:MAG: PAS domain-containing protein [Syntrophales bacterium]
MPIWLTTLIVIVMILLFSLMIYNAREREMVEQFNKQQMAIARGTAAGIEDLIAGIEKSIMIHTRLRGIRNDASVRDLSSIRIIYEDLEGKVEFVAAGNGRTSAVYPLHFKKKMGGGLDFLVREVQKWGRTYISHLVRLEQGGFGLIAVAVPQADSRNRVSRVVLAGLSLSNVVKRYIESAKFDISCDAWVVDDNGIILYHPDESLIGRDAAVLERAEAQGVSLRQRMLSGGEGCGEYMLVHGKEIEKNIIAYVPVNLSSRKWSIAISTPYYLAISNLKKTFNAIMAAAMILIFAILVGSLAVIHMGRKRIRLEEELKHLREKDKWQERLAREKRTVEGIIEGSPIPTFVINRDHKIIFWNRACTELTGYSGEEMIGTERQYIPFYREKRPVIADLIVDRDIEGLEKYYGKRVQKSAVVEGAYEASDFYRDLGGKERYLYFLAAPIYDENREIIAAIETLQDMTREKRMELDLKGYAETLKNELNENIKLKKTIEGVIEGSPIPMFVIDRDHKIIFWNRACTELTGCSGSEMIGTDRQYIPFYPEKRPVIADLIIDRDTEGLARYYGKKRVQKSTVVEGAYEASDFYENLGGKQRHLYFLAAPIYDENGDIIGAIETLQDVTRERQMELGLKEYAETLKDELDVNINLRKEIEELYRYLQSIMESSPDRIFALSSDGVINYASRGSDTAGDPGPEEIKGKHFTDLFNPEHRDLILARWADVKRGIFKPFEIEVAGKGGPRRNLLITASPIKGTDRYIMVQRDITEFKTLEQRFYESQKLAAVGQLSAGIAHEVRNPLSSIKMSLQILEKRLKPEGNDLKRFKIAQKEVDHLEKLVNDILIFAKPAEPDFRIADINAFVEQSLHMAEKEISDKKIDVRIQCDRSIAPLKFDSSMLNQALLNIYINAVDAMEENGKLTISTRSVRNGGKSVEIAIEDSGCGISAQDIPYIFNPFFTRKKYGTGLGLTQVKKIIELHQGTIEISSRLNEGTRVTITLPAE